MVPDPLTGGPRFAAFCERFVVHTKGRWHGQPLVLEPWQREFAWEALEIDPATGMRVYSEVGLGLPRKNGKALALDTPIPTPGGWSTMGELPPDDEVFDERGRPCRVVATSEVMLGRTCYRVAFSDGTSIVADAEHEWPVECRLVETAELAAGVAIGRHDITAIEPVPSVPVRCISVDSPSRLYLAGEAMVPTHNSLLASAFGHYLLVADGEAEPEVYIAAAARGQAGIVLGQARRIGLQSPRPRRQLRIQTHLIECPRNGGIMRALSADAALQHGLNPSANIIDELHAHRDGALYTALTTGTLAREQPFTLWITTAGSSDSFLADMHRVMDTGVGELEDQGALRIYRDRTNGTLIWWYGAPEGADIEDPDVWRAANPASWLQDGRELAKEYARLRARGALVEWRTYHLNVFVEQLESWMPAELWAGRTGEVTLRVDLPTYACVRIAHDHRSPAVAVAQRHGETVVLTVRTFPEVPLAEREYVPAEPIEEHLRDLHRRYPARVTAEVVYHPGGRVHHRPMPGPEVAHHGAFFEPSRQRLAKDGVVLLDVPSTAERLGPAAAALMQLVTSGALVHDGHPELARQMARVVARPLPRGWSVASGSDETIVTAQAAMLAVQRAMTAPRAVSRRVRGL